MEQTPSERDRIADERDRRADLRDRRADERDRRADERDRDADERERNAGTRTESVDDTVPVDDDQFGIDLGPPRNEPDPVEPDEALPPPVKPATKTLSERLAAAAADRDDADG